MSGNDTLTGNAEANILEGGAGADMLDGGAGIDTASYARFGISVTINLAVGTATGRGGFVADAARARSGIGKFEAWAGASAAT